MCCLKYEQAAYEDSLRAPPWELVQTRRAGVTEVWLLTGNLKVALEKYQNGTVTVFHKDQVRPSKADRREEKEAAPVVAEDSEVPVDQEGKPERKTEGRRPRSRRRDKGNKKPSADQ